MLKVTVFVLALALAKFQLPIAYPVVGTTTQMPPRARAAAKTMTASENCMAYVMERKNVP